MNNVEIKNSLPYGYAQKVAEKAGVTITAVSRYLSGKTKSLKIEMAALEVLAQISEEKKAFTEKIK